MCSSHDVCHAEVRFCALSRICLSDVTMRRKAVLDSEVNSLVCKPPD